MKKSFFAALIIITLIGGGTFYWHQHKAPAESEHITLFGNVDIRTVDLGFRVAGKITAINFQEGERVQREQVVARLDSAPYQDELNFALAQQQKASAQLDKMQAGNRPEEIAQAAALVRERQATVDNLHLEYTRQQKLVTSGAVAQRSFDNISASLTEARARLATATAALQLARAGFRHEEIATAQADLHATQARTASARTRLKDTSCTAPAAGIILTRAAEPGAIVAAGQTVLSLALDTPAWIRAYIEEPYLGFVQPGQTAQIFSDSHPQQPVTGHIGYISPEAEFTPKTVQSEQLRTQLVYQVRLLVDDADHSLRQGMPVTIKLWKNTVPTNAE